MNDYTGKICPFCKTAFKPGDEIVVCSECDMPHHKDCWIENQGCTTFGCLGTIKSTDDSTTSVTAKQMNFDDTTSNDETSATIYCTRCGAPNESTSCFCSKCGNRLTTTPPPAQAPVYTQANPQNTNPYAYVNPINPVYQQQGSFAQVGYNSTAYQSTNNDMIIQQLVGVKADYYIPKFQTMKAQNKQTSWNWPAFLVAPYWMIYRKMYGYGAGALAVSFVFSLIGSGLLSLLLLAGYIVFGVFANNIYMKFIESKAGQAQSMSEPFRTQFIAKNSGVNTTATILTVVGYVLLTVILSI